MPTTTKSRATKKSALTDYAVYAPLGAGQFVIEKSRELSRKAWTKAQANSRHVAKGYHGLAVRGERVVDSVRRSRHTKRAAAQAKTARAQVTTALTGIRKSAESAAAATKSAAKKVG
jgi:multidrug resistance efflux pump